MPQKIRFIEDLPVEEVYRYLGDSRISVIFSRREGSCVVVAESFFADTPVALLHGAPPIGSSHYINDRTGVFLKGSRLDRQLKHFLETSDTYHPRGMGERGHRL